MNRRSLLLTICFSLVVGGSAQAQTPPGVSQKEEEATEKELLELLNTPVVSASKVAQRSMDAPAVIAGLQRSQLEDYNEWNFADVLWRQPGYSQSTLNVFRNVDGRGIHESVWNSHILLLIDGMPFNVNLTGEAQLFETPLFFAKSVEVLRGPGSALYGTSAVNGVASMRTLSAEDLHGGGEAMVRSGSFGQVSLDAITGVMGDLVSVVAGYHRLRSDGYSYPTLDASGRTDPAGNLVLYPYRDGHTNDYALVKLEGEGALKGWGLQYHLQNRSIAEGPGSFFYFPDEKKTHEVEGLESWVLSYRQGQEVGLSQEYIAKFQRRTLDNDYRWFPADLSAPGDPGQSEVIRLHTDEWLLRAQWTYAWKGGSNAILGVEGARFIYDGDDQHTSNLDINYNSPNYFLPFFPSDPSRQANLNPALEWTLKEPVGRVALYAQYASGRLAGDLLNITAGFRYDRQSSTANDLDRPTGVPGTYNKKDVKFSKVSPRLGLVFHGGEAYAFKVLVGRAFRSPSMDATFSANTYQFGSTQGLQPEVIDTFELVSDWQINGHLNWRANAFQSNFKDFIGFESTFVRLENVYTQKTRGLETELFFSYGGLSGFLNASYIRRVGESTTDPGTHVEPSNVVWTPDRTAKAGLVYKSGPLAFMASARYQGPTRRRGENDFSSPYTDPRPDHVAGWVSTDLKASWAYSRRLALEVGLSNAFDTKGGMAEIYKYPFDYRIEGRSYFFGLRVK